MAGFQSAEPAVSAPIRPQFMGTGTPMRWFFRGFAAVFLIWIIYAASPYVALYSLAKAVEAGDAAAIEERIDFQAVRLSLSRQIVSAYMQATGNAKETSSSLFGQVAAGAGASLI